MRLVIKTPLLSLNETIAQAKNQAYGFSPYARQKREAEGTIMLEIHTQLLQYQKKFSYLPKWEVETGSCFHFRWYTKNRRRDPDNIASACKFIFDAMIKQGCLENDSWKYVQFISHDFHVDKDNPRVEVLITSIPIVIDTGPRTLDEFMTQEY